MLLSFEHTLNGLAYLFREKRNIELPCDFRSSIQNMTLFANNENNSLAVKKLEDFCFENIRLLQLVNKIIPDGILPNGYTGILHDIKVKKGNDPDDKIYSDNPEIQKLFPRGITTMILKKGDEEKKDVAIYANRKFIEVKDEDDQKSTDEKWGKYFLENPNNAFKIICTEKLNGEAVHFSARYIDGKFYLITGSKNVHLLIGEKKDIETYTEEKYRNAKLFARSVFDMLEIIPEKERQLFFSFLHHTKVTAVCEILQPDYQHIVPLSHLEKSQLNLLTFTPTASGDNHHFYPSLTAFPPHYCLMLGEIFGFPIPSWTVIYSTHLDDHLQKIKGYHNKEGDVLYFMNKDGNTIGISKAKSVWYIFLRALREKSCYTFVGSKKKYPFYKLEEGIKLLKERYDEIMTRLHISMGCVNEWKSLSVAFMEWLEDKIKRGELRGDEMRPKFPVWWKKFLNEKGLDDDFLFCYEEFPILSQ